jgi:putative DNA primase/helicase
MLEAALAFAARGWPVFPCNMTNKQPLLAAAKDPKTGAKIKGTGGVSRASLHGQEIRTWWKRWPMAMVGLATGHERLFVVDFDPRHDAETGEEWTLERLKAELEAQIGCALPATLAARTPSGGVHLYFLWPDDGGTPIRNRGNLPLHVDVRGVGGYVIAPPSVMEDGRRYRWLHGAADVAIAEAPPSLVSELRAPKRKEPKAVPAPSGEDAAADQAASVPSSSSPGASLGGGQGDDPVAAAKRRYAMSALERECETLGKAPLGARNNQANASGFVIGQLVGAGALGESFARAALHQACAGFNDPAKNQEAVDNGLDAGMASPRDLSDVEQNARRWAERAPPRSLGASLSLPAPQKNDQGKLSSHLGVSSRTGINEGSGESEGEQLTRHCAFRPLTDLGNLERLLERFGRDFLYVEAWGWLAWDGRRWDRDMAQPLLSRAAQATARAIQEEADFVRRSGVPFPDRDALSRLMSEDGDESTDERKAKIKAWHRQQAVARQVPDHGGERLDSIVQVKSNGEILLYSDKLAAWGRTSESSGHIGCLGRPDMAGARCSARTEDFDTDPLKLNVLNGTLVFLRPDEGYGAAVSRREHRREDRMTKLADVEHDPASACPKFDAFLERVQPDPDMRSFLDVWAGYNALGLADAQKFALFYGEGSNGKGVWVNTVAGVLGDYAWAAGIETFIDQGRYKKGSDASPDLAALAGRRMVYANEPEEGSKFSDGLVKALTSDEPKGGVRELMKAPFELRITFTNTIMANNLPKIGTDHGIQRRVQVVPWTVIIPDSEADLQLKDKLKVERSGILNRMVTGALSYLDNGLPKPSAIVEATREYQQENDQLGLFVTLCVARVPGERVGARPFHRVFAAWQTWAGLLPASGKPWSEKYLGTKLKQRGFASAKSSTNRWENVALRYEATDFCVLDMDGKIVRPIDDDLPEPKTFAGEAATMVAHGLPPPVAERGPAPLEHEDDDGIPWS